MKVESAFQLGDSVEITEVMSNTFRKRKEHHYFLSPKLKTDSLIVFDCRMLKTWQINCDEIFPRAAGSVNLRGALLMCGGNRKLPAATV